MTSQPLDKVLCVEDELDIQMVVRLALENVGGLRVEVANNGIDALRQIITSRPDLVLLDVMMPGMDGRETLRKLKNNPETADIPVVFMTAKVQANEIDDYIDLGALAVIPKPFDPMVLPRELTRIWNRYQNTKL